ncbi:hypothetical protein ACJJTC_010345 [Scirpophaga incertulas]
MYFSSIGSRLLLYDTSSWNLKKSYGAYDGILRDISWSDDSKYMLQVNAKGLVEVLSAAEHGIRSLQHIPVKGTWCATFNREGHRNIAIGTKTGNVLIWDTKIKSIVKTFPTPNQPCVNIVSYNAKNTNLAATIQNGDTVIYSLLSNIPLSTVKLQHSRSISAMKFHHESRSLLGLATDEGHMVLRDITTNKDKIVFENVHASPVSDFVYSLINKDVMMSCGLDKIMHVYDVRLQSIVSTIRTSLLLTSVATNSETLVALGTKNRVSLIYDLRDLTTPFQVLEGHEEEVRRVAFQPSKNKALTADTSLIEDPELNQLSHKLQSPVQTRTSDMFFIADSPPKTNNNLDVPQGEIKADSFLVMMGLDKTTENSDNEVSRSDQDIEKPENWNDFMNTEKKLGKISTPLNGKISENFGFPTPIVTIFNDSHEEINSDMNISEVKHCNSKTPNAAIGIDSKVIDELKDFIKFELYDICTDSKNYYLSILMEMTKQKLYMNKQLADMNNNLQSMMQSVNALTEANRKLVLELNQLKAKQNMH